MLKARLAHVFWLLLGGITMSNSIGCAQPGAALPQDPSTPLVEREAELEVQSVAPPESPPTAPEPNEGARLGGLAADTLLDGPPVYFIGRVEAANANTTILGWPGTQVVGGFSGPSIGVKLRDGVGATSVGNNGNNYFDVSIDDGDAFVLKLEQSKLSYQLATNLADGNHVVRLIKRTEAKIGHVAFDGFVYAAGHAAIATPTPLARRLEFLGDSGCTGYGADGRMPCVFSAATQNAAQSYPLIVARRLAAAVNDVGYSGKGLYQNRDPVNDANKTLPVLWRRTFPDAWPVKTWNPNAYIPDAMVMILSGNDFGSSVPEPSAFIAKLKPFVGEVRSAYPNAYLFIMVSPLLPFPNRSTAKDLALGLIDSVGDPNFAYIDVAPETGTHGWGCDNHLTGAAAAAVANQVSPVLQKALGW